jgi:plasmid stabilization system protein ParE
MHKLIIRPKAKREMHKAKRWYNKKEAGLGDSLLEEANQKVVKLALTPLMHSIFRYNLRRSSLQRFPYSILYLVESSTVIIIAFLHHKQDIDSNLEGRIEN